MWYVHLVLLRENRKGKRVTHRWLSTTALSFGYVEKEQAIRDARTRNRYRLLPGRHAVFETREKQFLHYREIPMYQWKRERAKPSKPVGPSKKQLDAVLATCAARVKEIYQAGMDFSDTSKEYAVLAGGQRVYFAARKVVEHALFVGKHDYSGTQARAACLQKHVDWLVRDVANDARLLADGYYNRPNPFLPEVPAEILKAKAVGEVEAGREVLELFAGIGVVPSMEEAA